MAQIVAMATHFFLRQALQTLRRRENSIRGADLPHSCQIATHQDADMNALLNKTHGALRASKQQHRPGGWLYIVRALWRSRNTVQQGPPEEASVGRDEQLLEGVRNAHSPY